MSTNYENELLQIKNELRRVIRELDDIANGVRYDFAGIGNARCADCITNQTARYRRALRKLEDINISKLLSEYSETQVSAGSENSGGGGSVF